MACYYLAVTLTVPGYLLYKKADNVGTLRPEVTTINFWLLRNSVTILQLWGRPCWNRDARPAKVTYLYLNFLCVVGKQFGNSVLLEFYRDTFSVEFCFVFSHGAYQVQDPQQGWPPNLQVREYRSKSSYQSWDHGSQYVDHQRLVEQKNKFKGDSCVDPNV